RFVNPEPSVFTLNTVPLPDLPPSSAVPYRVSPDKINRANGRAPSLLVEGEGPAIGAKVCRILKPVPSVLTVKTVPAPKLPPSAAAPYSVLPDRIRPAEGKAPSLLV